MPRFRRGATGTEVPLRQRIRNQLEKQRRDFAKSASLAQATPEQLRELASAVGVASHLQGNRQNYAEHVGQLPEPGPIHFNGLAAIGHQVEDAIDRVKAAEDEVYRSVEPSSVSDAEVEAALRSYLAERGVEYDPAR